MNPYQTQYSQGLVPAIQQMQPMQQAQQLGAPNAPNAGQDAYLSALQAQIKATQQAQAESMEDYQDRMAQSKKKEGGGGFWGALGGIIAKAAPIVLAAL